MTDDEPTPGAPDEDPREGTSPLDALRTLAVAHVEVADGFEHVEAYTMSGLLTMLCHGGPERSDVVLMCGGAMGGLLGPGDALYHRLGEVWSQRGVPVLRVSYRKPNDLDLCCVDVAAAVQLAIGGAGADQVVLMGHSFGGAIAVRVGVGLNDMVAGVVTFATQSAGCEIAAGLGETPLLLFHGERDEILPIEASEMVRMIAGTGELVRLPGDGHLLAKSDEIIWERLEAWLAPLVLRA